MLQLCIINRGLIKYFADEVQHNVMLGPLRTPAFEKLHNSPLVARSKRDEGTIVVCLLICLVL